jgi:hypothetical protein
MNFINRVECQNANMLFMVQKKRRPKEIYLKLSAQNNECVLWFLGQQGGNISMLWDLMLSRS